MILDKITFLQNLDLGENLIKSWSLVADIGCQLKNLKMLTISDELMT